MSDPAKKFLRGDDCTKRTALLLKRLKFSTKNLTGAFIAEPLRSTELLFHEVAHWLVLGGSLRQIPSGLPDKMGERMNKVSNASSNSLELDAALVTWAAGYFLGLWSEPEPIVISTNSNLKGSGIRRYKDTLEELKKRWEADAGHYIERAAELAYWYAPKAAQRSATPIGDFFYNTPVGVLG